MLNVFAVFKGKMFLVTRNIFAHRDLLLLLPEDLLEHRTNIWKIKCYSCRSKFHRISGQWNLLLKVLSGKYVWNNDWHSKQDMLYWKQFQDRFLFCFYLLECFILYSKFYFLIFSREQEMSKEGCFLRAVLFVLLFFILSFFDYSYFL